MAFFEPPGSRSRSSPIMQIRVEPDPDPHHCWFLTLSFKPKNMRSMQRRQNLLNPIGNTMSHVHGSMTIYYNSLQLSIGKNKDICYCKQTYATWTLFVTFFVKVSHIIFIFLYWTCITFCFGTLTVAVNSKSYSKIIYPITRGPK